jgi:hypothetical protein
MTDVSQQYLVELYITTFLFQENLWGKNISINIPAVSQYSTINGLMVDHYK